MGSTTPGINLSFSPNLDRTQSEEPEEAKADAVAHSLRMASQFNSEDNMNELIGLCSGKFTDSIGPFRLIHADRWRY